MKTILLFISILYSMSAYTQAREIDSLQTVLQTQKEDTNKVKTLQDLSNIYLEAINYKIAMNCASKALILSKKLNYKNGIAISYELIGNVNFAQINFTEALKYYLEALKINQETGDKTGIAQNYRGIGRVHYMQDNDAESLKYFYVALKQFEEVNDVRMIGTVMINIGAAYYYLHNYPEALKNYEAALNAGQKANDKYLIASAKKNIGVICFVQANALYVTGDKSAAKSKYASAIQNHQTAIKMFEEAGDKPGLMQTFPQLGNVYEKLGAIALSEGEHKASENNFSLAFKNYIAFLRMAEEFNDKNYISEACNDLGSIYIKLKEFSKAKDYLEKGLRLSKEIGFKVNMRDCYGYLSDLYSIQGNFKQAYKHYKLFVLYSDSLVNEENTKKSLQTNMQYDFDKKQDSIKSVQDKKDALAVAEIKNQKLVRNFSLTGALAIISFGGYSFYRYRRRRKLQSQQEMLNERLRISRELHDDMGSTLGSISIYSEVAKNRSVKNENADEVISKIGIASRELIEKMSDIVWSINPNNESFEQLQNRMQSFAAMILTPQGIQYNFMVDDEAKEIQLTTAERKNIFLIFKEAIYNIVKYADCSKVDIKLSIENRQFEMIIRDDGKGFDSLSFGEGRGEVYNGNGLKNMQTRAGDINAQLDIHSVINEGTAIKLRLKI